jgi:hypothetical protein
MPRSSHPCLDHSENAENDSPFQDLSAWEVGNEERTLFYPLSARLVDCSLVESNWVIHVERRFLPFLLRVDKRLPQSAWGEYVLLVHLLHNVPI